LAAGARRGRTIGAQEAKDPDDEGLDARRAFAIPQALACGGVPPF